MARCCLSALLALSTTSATWGQANAAISRAEDASYRAWQGERFGPPQAASLDRPPLPLAEEPESARRVFELGAEMGVAVPHCPRSDATGCGTLAGGTDLGIMLLMRPSPYFAFGGEVRSFAFTLPNGKVAPARASALFAGVSGRVYFLESGSIDPYLELALGAGSLDLRTESDAQNVAEEVELAPSARAAAGVDFAFGSFFRIGPFFAWTRYAPASVAHCAAGACVALEPRWSGVLLGATSLGVRLTLAAGESL